MKEWKSCAKWPDGLLSFAYADHDNTTRDGHETEEQAQGVCELLEKEGLGGERCHFPLKTWVEHVPQNKTENEAGNSVSLLGVTVNEGDQISGSWRNFDGKTYYGEGLAELAPCGWIMRYESGGLTDLDKFFHLEKL